MVTLLAGVNRPKFCQKILNRFKHDLNKTLESFNLTMSHFNFDSISNSSELKTVILPIFIENIEGENITLPAWSLLEEAVRNVTNVALGEYPNTGKAKKINLCKNVCLANII